MARGYVGLLPSREVCSRCFRNGSLFGTEDLETGWMGWCHVCNEHWRMHSVISSSRCCSIKSNLACSLLGGVTCISRRDVQEKILSFIFIEPTIVLHIIMQRHVRNLRLLEWTSTRLDWYVADEIMRRHVRNMRTNERMSNRLRSHLAKKRIALEQRLVLQSFRHVLVLSPSFERQCFNTAGIDVRRWDDHPSLLHAILSYLMPYDLRRLSSSEHTVEHGWHLFRYQTIHWLWNQESEEWFYIDTPTHGWVRYKWFIAWPRTAKTMRIWWHNAKRRRWFVEPNSESMLEAFYAYSGHKQDSNWQLFQFQGVPWLWNNVSQEWFYLHEPMCGWTRYKWFVAQPKSTATLKIWWHNAMQGRWFTEPSTLATLESVFAAELSMPTM